MLRVIIADDEERICKLIGILAEWERLGMSVVGMAGNGLDALAQVQSLAPDILITDIRMPGCDGLELIRRAKAAQPALEIIIISGYAQFDYAQTAIQYGVGDYLLKPINREALNGTLEKMGERCRARRTSEQDMEHLRLSTRDDRARLRANLVTDLLEGRYAAQNAGTLARTYRFDASDGGMLQTFLLKMDYDTDQFGEQSLQIVRTRIRDVLEPALASICGDFLLEGRDAAVWGVLHYPAAERGAVRARLRESLNQLVGMRNLLGQVSFSLALGCPVRSPDALPLSLENARGIIAERLTEGCERVLEGDRPAAALREADLLARYARDAAHAIELLSDAEAEAAARALDREACATPGVHGWELLQLVQSAGTLFVTRLGAEDRAQALALFSRDCGQCTTPEALFARLRALQAGQLAEARARLREQDGQPIRMAKAYIRKHFETPLTLDEVSAACGFSVSYFSTLFKKETGEGFAKYLARVRIDEAKALLRETRLSVADICQKVGYGDIKHFTRMFKAETGITPGEFRKLYG